MKNYRVLWWLFHKPWKTLWMGYLWMGSIPLYKWYNDPLLNNLRMTHGIRILLPAFSTSWWPWLWDPTGLHAKCCGLVGATQWSSYCKMPQIPWLGRGSKTSWVVSNICLCSPLFGEDSQFEKRFFKWVAQPPTRTKMSLKVKYFEFKSTQFEYQLIEDLGNWQELERFFQR